MAMAMSSKLLCTAFVMICSLMLTTPRFCDGRDAALVHGTVFCDTCSNNRISETSYFISGASVAVQCEVNRKTATSIRVEGTSDERGEFRIEVPAVSNVKKCRVELGKTAAGSWCNVPSISTSPKLTLSSPSDGGGVRTYAAGYLSYRPENVPTPCLMNDRRSGREALESSADETSKATTPPPLIPAIPALPTFPPFPTVPTLPTFPPFPTVPTLPTVPPFPAVPTLPTVPPFPAVPTLPTVPPFPAVPTLPTSPPFLPNAPPLPPVTIPPVPQFSFPPLPFNFPPIPFFTPPPPSK